jgi:outer membrane lipoprotein-sorting protein
MKRFGLIVVMVVLAVGVFAQKDESARKILDKVANTYKAYGSFSIEFSLTMENKAEEIKETSNGCADIQDGKYKVCLMGTETYFDGKTRYSYIKDAEEVNISEVDEEDESMLNPAKIFDLYKTGFNYRIIKESKENGKTVAEVELVPVDDVVEYKSAIVKIEKLTSHILSFTTIGKEGNNVTIMMKKLIKDRKFNEGHFVFDAKAHPDVEVIDMR